MTTDLAVAQAAAADARARSIEAARAQAVATGDAAAAIALLTPSERAQAILSAGRRMRSAGALFVQGLVATTITAGDGARPAYTGRTTGKAKRRAKGKAASAARRRNR